VGDESGGANGERSVSPYLWMVCGSLAFAVMGTLAHALRLHCDWRVIALARSGIALAGGAGLALAAGARLVFWRPRILWMRSIAGSCSLVGTFYALTRLPVSDVLTLTQIFPVWVALLSWPLLGERPGLGVWLAVLSGAAGVTLIQQPHFAEGNFASLVALASSVFTAVAMLGLHKLQGIDHRAVVVHFSAVSSLFCLATFALFDTGEAPLALPEGGGLAMLLGVGTAATVGQLFLTRAFAAGPPARVSVVGLTQVIFALVIDFAVLHQPVDGRKLVGVVLVGAPAAWLMASRPTP
jgi:drug/metabolite transporter (DMT)-like permease